MALTTQSFKTEPSKPSLEEGYEFVVDSEGRRSLKKIRVAEAPKELVVEAKPSVKKTKKKK